jgi:hypothetical protein
MRPLEPPQVLERLWLNSRMQVPAVVVVDGLRRRAVLLHGQEQLLTVHLQLRVETVHHRLLGVHSVQAPSLTD